MSISLIVCLLFNVPVHVEVIVGVNKYKLETEEPVDVLSIDNSKVIETQVRREMYVIERISYV